MMINMIQSGSFPARTDPELSVQDNSTMSGCKCDTTEKKEAKFKEAPANKRMNKIIKKEKIKTCITKKQLSNQNEPTVKKRELKA